MAKISSFGGPTIVTGEVNKAWSLELTASYKWFWTGVLMHLGKGTHRKYTCWYTFNKNYCPQTYI